MAIFGIGIIPFHCIKEDVQNYMSLFNVMRYNSEQEKTDLMMSVIPDLCTECELSSSLQFELRLSDRDSKMAAFAREVAKIRELVVVVRERTGYFDRVLKENISTADIAAVIKHIRCVNTKFFNIEYHMRSSTVTPELQRIHHIIRFLHLICDRLNDGCEWLVQHEFQGPWTLHIMNEENIFRTNKNPEPQQVVEVDARAHNPSSLPDRGHNRNAVSAHLDELKALI